MSPNKGHLVACTTLIGQKYVRKTNVIWWHKLHSLVRNMSVNKGVLVAQTTLVSQKYVRKQGSLCGTNCTCLTVACQQTKVSLWHALHSSVKTMSANKVSLWHALHSSVKTMSANKGPVVACTTLIGQKYVRKQRSLNGMNYID